MNDIAELKQYVGAHAESLGIPADVYTRLLDRIRHDGTGPHSWVGEWSAAAADRKERGELLEASQFYNFARFPYVDGPARAEALRRCVAAVDRWRAAIPGIEPLELELPGGRLRGWGIDLDAAAPRPLLLITGGIVSIKEQWAPVLLAARQLGLAGLVTEMPGVGENTLTYTPDGWRMLPALLDALAGRADTGQTYVMAMSFSGQAALRAAVEDSRIRGVVTAGAPVHHLFLDADWRTRLPRVTVDTLTHMAGGTLTDLSGWALTPAQLSQVDVPLYYVASLRDEIVPRVELKLLRATIGDLHLLQHDDVHGAPRHAAQTRRWMVEALVHMRKAAV